ncbi:MAG: hypothetical protein CVU05_14930 [Bacteroidetes bacterium HGW-Bacteroidetes-21]|nr:MAG: hypothetical protein CVU05_14930 [Bacteroidetes bacterium HGW-Bacteroidetes-21]
MPVNTNTMKNVIIIFSILLFGCRSANQQNEKIISPSKKYYLTTTVNASDNSKGDAEVVIHLYSTSGQLKFSLNTHAGDFSKWAVGWDKINDTVILFSSDIGTYAWQIEMDSLTSITLNDNLMQVAKEIKINKFSNNP